MITTKGRNKDILMEEGEPRKVSKNVSFGAIGAIGGDCFKGINKRMTYNRWREVNR